MDRPRRPSPNGTGQPLPAWAERMVRFLDDGWVVPGTNLRFGFDALLGLIPGIGDFVGTASSLSLVWLAYERGVPLPVMMRILFNVGLDALIGAVPLLGDLFDVVYKANRRNLTLLQRYENAPAVTAAGSGGMLALVVVGVIVLLTIPLVLAILIVRLIVG